jgi:hypothetical protein
MKILAILSLVLGGGSAIALQNDTISETVSSTVDTVTETVSSHLHSDPFDDLSEGLPYPPDAFLDQLTEEQASAVLALVDSYNASYDFSTLTEEETEAALELFKADMSALFDELGIDFDALKPERPVRTNSVAYVQENGVAYLSDEVYALLTEEQATTLTALIDTYNETYDWASMTEEDIQTALETLKADLDTLETEFGVDFNLHKDHTPLDGGHKDNKDHHDKHR